MLTAIVVLIQPFAHWTDDKDVIVELINAGKTLRVTGKRGQAMCNEKIIAQGLQQLASTLRHELWDDSFDPEYVKGVDKSLRELRSAAGVDVNERTQLKEVGLIELPFAADPTQRVAKGVVRLPDEGFDGSSFLVVICKLPGEAKMKAEKLTRITLDMAALDSP